MSDEIQAVATKCATKLPGELGQLLVQSFEELYIEIHKQHA
jgi:hypothetical protein